MLNQRGFSPIHFILVLFIVGIVSFTGLYVWDTKQEINNKQSYSDTTAPAVAVKTKYSKLPAELQDIILQETKKQAPECVKNNQIVDFEGNVADDPVTYAASGSAITAIGCDGGSAAALFAKDSGGTWKFIESTQEAFSCDKLKQYNIPIELLKVNGEGQADPTVCLKGEAPNLETGHYQ